MRSHISTPVSRRFVAIVFALLATLAALPAHAAWQPGGVRLSSLQSLPPGATWQEWILHGLVPDGVGGVLALWTREVTYESDISYELVAQRVDASGNIPAPWSSAGKTVRTWVSYGSIQNVKPVNFVSNGAGGGLIPERVEEYYVGYFFYYFQIYGISSTGIITGFPNYSGPTFRQLQSAGPAIREAHFVDSDGQGGAILMATRPKSPPTEEPLYTSRILPTGEEPWGVPDPPYSDPIGPILAYSSALQGERTMIADRAGGAYYAWSEIRASADGDLFLQRLDANGAVVTGWPAGGLRVCGAASFPHELKLALRDDGGVFALWADKRDGQPHLYAASVDGAGNLAPGVPADGRPMPSSHPTDWILGLIADGQGGAYVARGTREGPSGGPQAFSYWLHLHRLDVMLNPANGWPSDGLMLSTVRHDLPSDLDMLADGTGGLFIVSRGVGAGLPLVAQHLDGNGAPAPGWSAAGYTLDPAGSTPMLERSSIGAIVVWRNYSQNTGGIFAQGLVPDGPVAVQLSLVGATAEPGNVSLHWYATGAAMLAATVERRSDDSEWKAVRVLSADGAGHLRYEDGSVAAGRFGYRVRWTEDGSIRNAGEVWVDVPDAWRLALSAPRPNPGSGPASFAVTLADRTPAHLELVDLQGRRVAQRDLGALGAGRHAITIDEAATLAPGIYLARLTQGGVTRTTRLIRIR